MEDILSVAVVNFRPSAGNKDVNLSHITGFTEAAAKRGADIVLFPEVALTGYQIMEDPALSWEEKLKLGETIDGPAVARIAELTKKYGIYCAFGTPFKKSADAAELYNAAVVTGPDGVVGAYLKIHPFGSENSWCKKGDEPFMFDTKWGPVSIGICYDTYHFPELMRYYAAKGARLYLNPTAVYNPLPNGLREGYLKYMESSVSRDQIFIASANLCGTVKTVFFGGGSMVLGPTITPCAGIMQTMAYAGDVDFYQEGLFIATIDLSLAVRELYKNNDLTGEPDYRPEIYKKLWNH